jgi:hypothetical protein
MKKALTISLAAAAMAATLSLVAAGSFKRGEATGSNARAADDNVSIAPLRAPSNAYAQNFVGVARIIHVPQSGERDERASINERDQPEAIDADDDAPVAPPPRRRVQPRWPPRSDALPPPSGPRRAVLSAPPPSADGPTPIRPTPRFSSKIDPAAKFNAPDTVSVTSDAAPPPDDNPPLADLPRGN